MQRWDRVTRKDLLGIVLIASNVKKEEFPDELLARLFPMIRNLLECLIGGGEESVISLGTIENLD